MSIGCRGEEFDRRLTELYLSGMSTPKIGVALGVTKNVVVGRAHRLALPERGSPVAPMTQQKIDAISALVAQGVLTREICRREHASLRTVCAIASGDLTTAAPMRARLSPMTIRQPQSAAVRRRAREDLAARPIQASSGQCCYPIGERDARRWIGDVRVSFLRCEAPAVRGPYCATHAAVCYRRADIGAAAQTSLAEPAEVAA